MQQKRIEEGNIFPDSAHCCKNMHPQLTTRVEELIARCWHASCVKYNYLMHNNFTLICEERVNRRTIQVNGGTCTLHEGLSYEWECHSVN